VKQFLFIGILFSFLNGFSQTSNKKKVLVIPYGRFEFTSEFTIEDIAAKNDIEASMVFNAYQKAILNQFELYKDENFQFSPITSAAYKPYRKYIKYVDGKFKGKHHYSVNIKQFPKTEFSKLMEEHDASFVVFLNWYQIKKESLITKGKKKKRYRYGAHYVDYEIYNLFQQKVIGVGKQKMEPKSPTEEEASYALLRLTDMDSRYQNFVSTLVDILNNPFSED